MGTVQRDVSKGIKRPKDHTNAFLLRDFYHQIDPHLMLLLSDLLVKSRIGDDLRLLSVYELYDEREAESFRIKD